MSDRGCLLLLLQVRVLVDRSIVEFFIANGRKAFTARSYPQRSQSAARITNLVAPLSVGVAAWEMGCGWVL
jgi:sucrose-6-phosphate hydrolase SacC (GH32 family)